MKPIAPRSLARNTEGSTTLEFALVSVVLIAMLFGGIEVGIMLWTRGTLQAIAAQTARCAALGSPVCNNTSTTPKLTPQLYAVNQAAAFLGSGLVTAGDVQIWVDSTCLNTTVTGTDFEVVKISSSGWFGVSPSAWFNWGFTPLAPSGTQNNHPDAVTACYPL